MSDTANPANLASSEEFDARLKRTDEDRWLATRYAPQAGRERLFQLFPYGYVKQACKIAGMRKPRAWSTG